MSNYTTIKNSLKKLEQKKAKKDKSPHCGVIYQEDYDKLEFLDEPERNQKNVGYLVVPRRLSMEEWVEKYGAVGI